MERRLILIQAADAIYEAVSMLNTAADDSPTRSAEYLHREADSLLAIASRIASFADDADAAEQ